MSYAITSIPTFIRDLVDSGGLLIYPLIFLTFFMSFLIACEFFIQHILNVESSKNSNLLWSKYSCGSTNYRLVLIKQCVKVSPLLGLLGTVTGMIEVFDIISLIGSSENKLIAKGFSHATVPTLFGMIIAIYGFCSIIILESFTNKNQNKKKNIKNDAKII